MVDKKDLFLTLKSRLEDNLITDEDFDSILKMSNEINKIRDELKVLEEIKEKLEEEINKKDNYLIGFMETLKYNSEPNIKNEEEEINW